MIELEHDNLPGEFLTVADERAERIHARSGWRRRAEADQSNSGDAADASTDDTPKE